MINGRQVYVFAYDFTVLGGTLSKMGAKKITKLMRAKYLRAIQFALNHKKTSVAAFIGAREISEANVIYLDSIYNGLSKKAKNTIYGTELATLIKARK